jgi:hypothetical protein
MTAVYQMPSGLRAVLRYFSDRPEVEADFSRGIVRDLPRSSIPVGGVYDAIDFLVDQPGLLRKRGGTAYQSSTLGASVNNGVNFVAAAEFPTGTKIMGRGADGHLYDCTAASSVDIGAFAVSTLDTPKLYVDTLVVASADGSTAPKKVTCPVSTLTIGNLGGSPPPGKLVTTHISRVVLGNSVAHPNRIWFSPVPNVESTWDTSNAYIDANHYLTALASIQGVLLAFSAGATERIVGNVPPGTTGENMSLQPLGQVGCADARSIAPWGSYIVFASQEGVYVTNGAGFDSLTEKPDGTGISSYWRQQYATVQAHAGFIAGGILNRNYYVLTLGYDQTIVDTLICYLPRKAWMRTSNIGCDMYAPGLSGTDELYGASMGGQPGNRLLKFSSILTPAAGNKNDANGNAVEPEAQFRMSGTGVGLKAYGDGHLTYDMRDAATDSPELALSVSTGIEADSGFTPLPESPLAATTAAGRKRFQVAKDTQAANIKIAQTNASSKTEIYLLEMSQRAYDTFSEVT